MNKDIILGVIVGVIFGLMASSSFFRLGEWSGTTKQTIIMQKETIADLTKVLSGDIKIVNAFKKANKIPLRKGEM